MTAYIAETLYREGPLSVEQIAQQPHIPKSTLYAYICYRTVPVGRRAAAQ
ncbi:MULTISPECIES: hypothetical protein [Mycetohabitans]|nr:hypothetical protein [Mycetohabitans sp. B4]MCG1017262.1 hypothetical protein [Mycetohabitans sp. B4]